MFLQKIGLVLKCKNIQSHIFRCGSNVPTYAFRTHTCGELSTRNADEKVTLCGWVDSVRYKGRFVILRDTFGATQIYIDNKDIIAKIPPLESVVKLHGTVKNRKPADYSRSLKTGRIEVIAEEMEILNPAISQLPFPVNSKNATNEATRLKYRYLDLRNSSLQRRLRLRSDLVFRMRQFLCHQNHFTDVETPTLFRTTPGGSREFIVPTHFPGRFYCLTQSPQQFKQLLMIGGLDRYMQVAKCYRDETSRPDRQPEFTQIDLEMSFVTREHIYQLVEDLLRFSWPFSSERDSKGMSEVPSESFPRISYANAMQTFGTDKPDTRFDMVLRDLTHVFKGGDVGDGTTRVIGFVINQSNVSDIGQLLKHLNGVAKQKLHFIHKSKSAVPDCYSVQFADIVKLESLKEDDLLIFAEGPSSLIFQLMGKCRVETANYLEQLGVPVYTKKFSLIWVEDFPLFTKNELGVLESTHHSFTAAIPEHEKLIYSNPEQVTSQQYDLVCNGQEIAGGSIRIHDAEIQRYVLDKVLPEQSSSEMEHLLEALTFGAPPHGGIAIGLDRLVAIISESPSIRDVIAFPKSADGSDPLSKAPAPVNDETLDYYHITPKRNIKQNTAPDLSTAKTVSYF